jgi:hypothetical protein
MNEKTLIKVDFNQSDFRLEEKNSTRTSSSPAEN